MKSTNVCTVFAILVSLTLIQPARAATLSWSGGGVTDANWSNSANWGFAGTPANGDTLIFSAMQPNLLNTNNIAGLTLNQIRFLGPSGSYDIRGNAFTLTNNIEATNTTGGNTIENAITLAVADQTLHVTPGATLTLQGAVSGSFGINKTGGGTLQLYGATGNTYAGNTSVQGICMLSKSSGNSIPNGILTVGDNLGTTGLVQDIAIGGNIGTSVALRVNNASKLDLNNFIDFGGLLTLDGGTIQTGSGTLFMNDNLISTNSTGTNLSSSIFGRLALNGATRTFSVYNFLFVNAAVTGTGGIIENGPFNMYLTASNGYSGLTVVQSGVLFAQNPWALGGTAAGTVVSNGATLSISGGIGITNETVTLNGPGVPGWASLDNENPETNIWAGPVILAANSSIGNYQGGQIRVIGPISGPGGFDQFYSGGAVSLEGSTANTYAGLTTVNQGTTLLLNKSVSDGAIPGNLDVSGTLRLQATGQITNAADVNLEATGLFDFGVYWDRIDTLHGSGAVTFGTNGWIEVGGNNGGSIYYGTMSGVGYTLGGYTVGKFGTGTFIMNGNCTFTSGVIEVQQGALLANGVEPQVSATCLSTTTFGGAGSIGNLVAAGYVDPGNGSGTPNILTCTNATFFNSGGLIADLNGPVPGGANGYDQLLVNNGNVSLGSSLLTVYPSFTTPVAVGQTFTIINNTANRAISGTFVGLPQGAGINVGNYGFTITYTNAGLNNVVLTLTNVPGASAGYAVTAGNGSDGIDPNSCNYISLSISNKTGTSMTGVSATLLSETPNVFVTQPFSAYSDVPGNGTAGNTTLFQIATTTNFVCTTSINLNLAVTTADHGAFIVPFTLASGSAGPVPSRYDVSVITNIPDIGTIESTNAVSGFVGPIAKVAVSFWLTHPVDSDLTISLVAPNGAVVPLVSGVGSGANFGSACSPDANRTTFDDSAPTSITVGSPPFLGSYRPQSPLSALISAAANGNWRLRITDSVGGSVGALRCWSLFLYPITCPSGGGVCELCPNVTITGATGPGSPTETNYIFYVSAPSVCGVPKTCPGTITNGPFPADTYTFRNGPSNSCITVTVENDSPAGSIIAGAFSQGFNRNNPDSCVNYLADPGIPVNVNQPIASFSFNATSNQVFVINLLTDNVSPSLPYRLTVSGGDCRPALDINSSGPNQVTLDWTTAAANYRLESTNHLVTGVTNWPALTNVPIVINSKYVVTNTAPPGSQFYRLQKP